LTCSSTFASCIAREGALDAYPLRITNESSWAGECIERIKRHPFPVRFRALGLGKVDQGVNKKNIKKEKKWWDEEIERLKSQSKLIKGINALETKGK
jgi:hypothetical protein